MALLLTLTVMSLLIAVTVEINRRVRLDVVSTAAARDRTTLYNTASSGIHAAMAMLIKDRQDSDTDSVQEDWADPEKISEVLQDVPFERGGVTVDIVDEKGKIQVNALVEFPESRKFREPQRQLWLNFLENFKRLDEDDRFEDVEPETIINCLKDWMDFGDDDAVTGLSGAESDYYLDLEPPYPCRNAPVDHLRELMQVKGITPDVYSGDENQNGMSDFLTVFGMAATRENNFTFDGTININTAPLPVIAALLPSGDVNLAQALVEYRLETSDDTYIHDLSRPTWYKDVPGFGDETIDPKLITVVSDIFRIRSVAVLDEMKMVLTAVVRREKHEKTGKWTCRVLRWQPE